MTSDAPFALPALDDACAPPAAPAGTAGTAPPALLEAPQRGGGAARLGGAGDYAVCAQCIRRFRLAPGEALEDARCECGARLRAYEVPDALLAQARGTLPRLIRFWKAGREDGYWDERRFFRPAAAERAGVTPRAVRFAYEAGRRNGEQLRTGARAHFLRVLRMKAAAGLGARAA